jgi:ATP-binding cassette subfamily C protein
LVSGILLPQRGSVWYGWAPVAGLSPSTLADHRVLIPQEAYVFSGTVRENLCYLHEHASDAELDRAVDELGGRALVERLGGYDAELKPADLSAGESQLLTLIRAYLSPARLVILDEATCHLDPAAEAQAEMAFVRRGGTLIVIAHRISSALRAGKVLVLDGAEVSLGTHEELMGQSQTYRDLAGYWGDYTSPSGLTSKIAEMARPATSSAPARRVWVKAKAANHSGQTGKSRGGRSGRGLLRALSALMSNGSAPADASAGQGSASTNTHTTSET